jgi:L-fuconolactonase
MLHFPIVDAHVHLVDRTGLRYAWMAGAPALNRDWTPADFAARTRPYQIGGYVFVEADVDAPLHLEEARWIDRIAQTEPFLKGSVASLPLELGPKAVEADMARLASLGTVRGVRRLIQDHPDPEFMIRPDFVAAVKLLPTYNLSFDLCIKHPQLANTIELVRRCPEVSFILDHIAKPDIKAGLSDPWRANLCNLASFSNVVCKISGVLTEADHAGWTREKVRPYIDHAIACFGFHRLMFGGDWPVVELAGAYTQWLAVLDWATAGCSEGERRALFRDTAVKAYRLAM